MIPYCLPDVAGK